MTPEELAAIKARQAEAEFLGEEGHQAAYRARTDIPALVAEVERLRAVRDAAAEFVAMTVEHDGSDAWAAGNEKLLAALRAAGSETT